MDNKELNKAFLNLKPPTDELIKSFEELKKVIPNNISISNQPVVEEIKYVPVEIAKLDIHDGDTILLTFDMDECDLETANSIHKMWIEAFPTINIISSVKPIIKSIEIIHNKEEKPF